MLHVKQNNNALTGILYFILGLIAIAIAFRVILWVLSVTFQLISLAITVGIVVFVGYITYRLLKAAYDKLK